MATLTLGYVGRRGLHLTQLENINQLLPGTVQANPAGEAPDALRPYRGYSTILQDTNAGSSTYHRSVANFWLGRSNPESFRYSDFKPAGG